LSHRIWSLEGRKEAKKLGLEQPERQRYQIIVVVVVGLGLRLVFNNWG